MTLVAMNFFRVFSVFRGYINACESVVVQATRQDRLEAGIE